MSLAEAIQKAAPYIQEQQMGQAILNGTDPFAVIPGYSSGQQPSSDSTVAQVINKLKSLPSSSSIAAITGGQGLAQAPGGGPAPIYTPDPYKDPYAGSHFAGGNDNILNAISKFNYDQSNFNHYAAPSGSGLPFVGPNYEKDGALNGYVYDPYTDKYKVNENTLIDSVKAQGGVTNQAKLAQEFGLVPQTPSTAQTIMHGLLGVGIDGLGGALSSALSGNSNTGLLSKLGSLFGSSSSGPATTSSDPLLDYNAWANSFGGGGSGTGISFGTGSSPDFSSMLGDSSLATDSTASAPIGLPIIGSLLAAQAGNNMIDGSTNTSPTGDLGRMQLAAATGGLSEVANKVKSWF